MKSSSPVRVTKPGEKHLTASALLIAKSSSPQVLLLHHKKHDSWLQPGGHVEPDENPWQTAVRETWEETGIDITDYLDNPCEIGPGSLHLPEPDFSAEYLIPAYQDEPEHYHIDWLYVVQLPDKLSITNEDQKAHDIGWFTWSQTKNLKMFVNTRYFLEQFLSPGNLTKQQKNK